MNIQINQIGKDVIDLQINTLRILKNSLDKSFENAVNKICKCKSKVIISGVGKSGKIAAKISATLSSVGTPSFYISANDCSHGDLGRIDKNDLLILISYSGNTVELKNIIKYAKVNKIPLIGIVSNKDSFLYKSANVRLLIPKVNEAGHGIVPTSSTTAQLCLGDALAIASMKKKKISKLDFKRFHPGGNLGDKLKLASEIMLTKNKIPFVNENISFTKAIEILNNKKLGLIIIRNNNNLISGIFTDGDLKRTMQQKKRNIENLKIKRFMNKKPFTVEENTITTDILSLMNQKKITNIAVYNKKNPRKITGVIHIHQIIK